MKRTMNRNSGYVHPLTVQLWHTGMTDQVGQRQAFDSGVMDRHCCATTPQLWKRVDTAHLRHDINSHASRLGVLAPKMDRVTLAEIPWLKWWNGNNVCIQV
jgi:hypothetical protein